VGSLTDKQADLLFAAREDCERLQTSSTICSIFRASNPATSTCTNGG